MKSPSILIGALRGAFTGMYGTFPIVVIEIVTPLNDRVVRTEKHRDMLSPPVSLYAPIAICSWS